MADKHAEISPDPLIGLHENLAARRTEITDGLDDVNGEIRWRAC
ncbi:MAG: hypothetical protein ACKPEA_08200 [Planctomycetota bacterium]